MIDVIAKAVPVAAPLMFLVSAPAPANLVISTVGATPATSNIKPVGAFKIMVPVPTSPLVASSQIGPVNEVHIPPVLSAEMEDPPVAGVRML